VIGGLRRRLLGDYEVDAWGLDSEIYAVAMQLGRVRWDVDFQGLEHIPAEGPALMVIQRWFGISEQAVVSVGVASYTRRRARNVGVPGLWMMEAPLRRIGAALAHPDEVAGLLRDQHIVTVAMSRTWASGTVGTIDPPLVAPAVPLGVPVLPVATRGWETGRRWKVIVGAPLPPPEVHGHLGAVEVAAQARDAIEALHEADRERA